MTLEQLIENVQNAETEFKKRQEAQTGFPTSDEVVDAVRTWQEAREQLCAFVLLHADTFIAWERQHMLRTSPFDTDQ